MNLKSKKLLTLVMAASIIVAMVGCSEPSVMKTSSEAPLESESSTATSLEATLISDEDVDGELIFDRALELKYAKEFTLDYYKGGYKKFVVGFNLDEEFLIVPENKKVPQGLADNVIVLQQPLNNVTIGSTGGMSLVDSIGGLDNVASVGTEVPGWYLDNVIEKMNNGDIVFSGKFDTPDYELLTAQGTQFVYNTTMLSGHPEVMDKLKELDIPVIIETSAKESSPLARVEWAKLLGALFNLDEEAHSFFEEQIKTVEAVTQAEKSGKTVAVFYLSSSSDKVSVRNGGDYIADMVELAGGDYIMKDFNPEKTGTTGVTFEEAYAATIDADYIFYINFARKFYSLEEMTTHNPLFADFKAVKDGTVFITTPDFIQSVASIADIINDMNKVLKDPAAEGINRLVRLK